MRVLRILALISVLAFSVGFVGYLITRPAPGLHFTETRERAR